MWVKGCTDGKKYIGFSKVMMMTSCTGGRDLSCLILAGTSQLEILFIFHKPASLREVRRKGRRCGSLRHQSWLQTAPSHLAPWPGCGGAGTSVIYQINGSFLQLILPLGGGKGGGKCRGRVVLIFVTDCCCFLFPRNIFKSWKLTPAFGNRSSCCCFPAWCPVWHCWALWQGFWLRGGAGAGRTDLVLLSGSSRGMVPTGLAVT